MKKSYTKTRGNYTYFKNPGGSKCKLYYQASNEKTGKVYKGDVEKLSLWCDLSIQSIRNFSTSGRVSKSGWSFCLLTHS